MSKYKNYYIISIERYQWKGQRGEEGKKNIKCKKETTRKGIITIKKKKEKEECIVRKRLIP